jgi:UDP-glucose 4-epimerase
LSKIWKQLNDDQIRDNEKIYAENSLAKEELGWLAALRLAEMMSSAWLWQKKSNNM